VLSGRRLGTAACVAVFFGSACGRSGGPDGQTSPEELTAGIGFVLVAAATPQAPTQRVDVSYSRPQTQGNLNIVVVGWNDTTQSVTSVTDMTGNVYIRAVGPTRGTNLTQAIYYAPNIAASGCNTVSVQFTGSAAFADVRILEYTGLSQVAPLDQSAERSGTGGSPTSGTATTAASAELVFGAGMTLTMFGGAGSGFTSRIITVPDGDIAEDQIVVAPGSYAASAPVGGGPWVMQMATFKGAATAGGADAGQPHDAGPSPPPADASNPGSDAGGPVKIGAGATVNAAGCSASQVQSAIDAAHDGDTVAVPACSATWTTPVVVKGKSIALSGTGIGRTVITRNTSVGDSALDVQLTASETFTLSGFEFSTIPSAQWGIVAVSGDPQSLKAQFRITNCKVNVAPSTPTVGYRGMSIFTTYGVIDHCIITNASDRGQGISVETNGNAWTQTNMPPYSTPQYLGDMNAVVVEDSTFDFAELCDGALDAYAGTKFVFRYNTVTNTNVGWHGADSAIRSTRSFEVYQNKFQTTGSASIYTALRARGGTGVVWGNSITGNYNGFFLLSHYRADPAYGTPPGSNIDGNFDSTGYPLLDQVGRGSFPASTPWPNQSSYTEAQYEALDPMYQWKNNFKGDVSPTCDVGNPDQSATYIRPNRDYYDNVAKPGYVPLAYPHPFTK
jgi:hypothetical protein